MQLSTDPASGAAPLLAPSVALARFTRPLDELVVHAATRAEQTLRYGFRIGALRLLIGVQVHSEIIRADRIVPIPRTPRWLLGMTNLRGRPVPVFDLRVVVGEPGRAAARGRFVLVLDKGERAVGIEVDEHPSALRGLQRASAVAPPPARLAAFVAAAWTDRDDLWLEFEHRGFFESLLSKADI